MGKNKERETSKEAMATIQVKDSGRGWRWKEEQCVEKLPEVEEIRLKFWFLDVSMYNLEQIKLSEPLMVHL